MYLNVKVEKVGEVNYPDKDIPVHVFGTQFAKCLETMLRWDGEMWYTLTPVTAEDDDGKPVMHLAKMRAFPEDQADPVKYWCKQLNYFFRL
jgi:hypothetical protein